MNSINLPVIDLNDVSRENGQKLVTAAATSGFLYVSPHGTALTQALVDREFAISKEFFALPLADKTACSIGVDNRGWTGMHGEILDPAVQRIGDFKEALNLGEFTTGGRPNQAMPPSFQNARRETELFEFEQACRDTRDRILDLLALGLDMLDDPRWFSRRHERESASTVRLLYYPSIPPTVEYNPDVDVRAGAHSDYGSITLLFQRPSQPGLEIRPPDNSDTWTPVPVFPPNYPSTTYPPILVNIADLMSYWTGGLLRSTVHRVIFPKDSKGGQDRYSIAYFAHPRDDTELVAVPSRLVRQHIAATNGSDNVVYGYGGGSTGERAITAKEHLMKRLNATYPHLDLDTATA